MKINIELFRQRLREQRIAHKLSYKRLGELINVSDVTVLKWEKGLSDPSLYNFISLCKASDVSSDYILGLTDEY